MAKSKNYLERLFSLALPSTALLDSAEAIGRYRKIKANREKRAFKLAEIEATIKTARLIHRNIDDFSNRGLPTEGEWKKLEKLWKRKYPVGTASRRDPIESIEKFIHG